MIKFFRKIRQNLLMENKTRKYFKYAIGEILLVVIGILIALQINTLNQSRIDKKQETQILKSLKKEYVDNLNQLDDKIYIRKKIVHSADALIQIIDNKEEFLCRSYVEVVTTVGKRRKR